MSDSGEELGNEVKQKANTLEMEVLRNLSYARRYVQQQQASQAERNEQAKTPEQAEAQVAPDTAAPEIKVDGDWVTIPFSSEEVRDAAVKMLEGNGISAVSGTRPVILVTKDDLDRISPVIDERIKSHDGMDIDAHSGVVETAGYEWKQDVAERIAEARDAAIRLAQENNIPPDQQEKLFVRECGERGVDVGRAADGDYLYRLIDAPEAVKGLNARGIRGAALEKGFAESLGRFSREFLFSPGAGLDPKSIAGFLDSQRALSPERDVPSVDLEKLTPNITR